MKTGPTDRPVAEGTTSVPSALQGSSPDSFVDSSFVLGYFWGGNPVPANTLRNDGCLTAPSNHLDINIFIHHDVYMRTTLTLDDDVADFLKMQSRLLDRSFKQVVNDVLRRGMTVGSRALDLPTYRVVPNRSRLAPGIDPLRLNQLNDELEVQDLAAESGQ